ncbi:MAG TPA: aminopeptidase [Methanocella sp.]|nr:aminopeptidase [Methanocella sp.]
MYTGISAEYMGSAVKQVARSILNVCMGVKPGESVLVVTDNIRRDLGLPIYQAALEAGNDAVYMEMRPRRANGQEPPGTVAKAMYYADVIVAMTKVSLSHTQAKIRAVKHGARIATMPFGPGSTEFVTKIFTGGGMSVDYERMDMNMRRLARRLNGTGKARIVTEKGTDIVVNYGGREFRLDSGIVHHPGEFTNLPAGEVYIAPVSADGVVVVDVTMGRLGRLKSPIELHVEDGVVCSIRGERAEELETILAPFGPEAMNLAEFAIGMNPSARICGLLLEDEKVANTAHFALGSNSGFGGNVSAGIHMDGVVDRPTIYADGEKIDLNEFL